MSLNKQPVAINFARGLDTKSDPYQVSIGNFLDLENSVFTTTGRLTKRNGFTNRTKLPTNVQTTLTTLNDSLVATGSDLFSYTEDINEWINQGPVQPVRLDVQPLVRVSTSQQSPDSAISSSGLICLAYVDNGLAYYQISDSDTGQQVVKRTTLPTTATNPRVFLLGVYFIITFMETVTGTPHLQYIAIPTMNPSMPSASTTISADVSSLTAGYDGYSSENFLFLVWDGAASVNIAFLASSLGVSPTVVVDAVNTADLVSVTVDSTNATVWASYWDMSTMNGYVAGFSFILSPLVTPTQIITTTVISEITSLATLGVLHVYYETVNNYSYTDAAGDDIRSDYVSKVAVTPPVGVGPGIVSATTIILRSVGLASKATIQYVYTLNSNPLIEVTNSTLPALGSYVLISTTIYMLVAYGDEHQINPLDNSNQPSYFLIDDSGNIYMRLAYSNGGGYAASQVLPNILAIGTSYYVPYLVADFLAAVNKGTNLPAGTPSNAIYTQYGVNLATFEINRQGQYSSEIASALHLTGGQLWEYDGVKPVEHGFHVWPENIMGTTSSTTHTPTGNTLLGSNVITVVSSTVGVGIGSTVTGTGIPANQVVTGTTPTTITFGPLVATATGTTTTFTIIGQLTAQEYFYVFTYEWTDNAGNLHRSAPSIPFTITSAGAGVNTLDVPTDRLTYKQPFFPPTNPLVTNPIRIVGYRWSTAQEVYYQFTSLTTPYLNDTTIDSLVIVDGKSDAQILGNTILYTTGGVVEDIAAPASIASALFNNRLWLVDAEDQNLLWYSKQVIEAVPVEMSDLLTLYVAPTTGAQGSTGPITAIAPMDDKLIIFKKDAIYYINGTGPDNTGANSTYSDPVFVTSTVGCANPNSIVLMKDGLMFQSDKGIWILGRGLDTEYIGFPVEEFNSNVVKSATAIPGTNQVRFVLDDNTTLMYDYFVQQWGTHTNIAAISATLWQGLHTYLNTYGQIFQETQNMFLDGSEPVLMSLTTSWVNIAGLQGFERFYAANLLGTYFTPFKLNVELAYNYNPSPVQSVIVTPDNQTLNWGQEALWGTGGSWGNDFDQSGQANVFTARVFPKHQKCESFQVSIQEIYDPSFSQPAGQGLSLSGLLLLVGMKRGSRTQSARKSFG